jgi:hypothetical protein
LCVGAPTEITLNVKNMNDYDAKDSDKVKKIARRVCKIFELHVFKYPVAIIKIDNVLRCHFIVKSGIKNLLKRKESQRK